jgi:WD40 repeat protein
MNENAKNDPATLSLVSPVDQICGRFEAAWLAGQRPRIEDYLAAGSEPSTLLSELLKKEVEHRRQSGESPTLEEYRARFPGQVTLVDSVFPPPSPMHQKDEGARTKDESRPHGSSVSSLILHPSSFGADASGTAERESTAKPAIGGQQTISEVPGTETNTAKRSTAGGADLPAIPGYEIMGLLGRGGMGVVYQARHQALKRLVAVKMILAAEHAEPDQMARFRTEAEAVARLQHPHIVQIHEIGAHKGLPYFSLEFCPGGSLAKRLGGTPLAPQEAAALVEKLARAMDATHRKGVIHRDLKPANILLAEDGTPKISDFGLAKKLDEAGRTHTGAKVGTPSYMAPEQARGNVSEIGPAADTYALGAILYECLTGRPPFKAATVVSTLRQVLEDEPVPPTGLNAQVPCDLETICLKCLHKEPLKRYASAEELAHDLRRFLNSEPIRARPVSTWERAVKWAKRRPAAAALLGLGIVLPMGLLGGGLVYADQERRHAQKDAEIANREADNERVRAETERQLKLEAQASELKAIRHWYVSDMNLVQQTWREPHMARMFELLGRWRQPGKEDPRGFEWHYWWRLSHSELHTLEGNKAVRCVAFAPDGKTLASGGQESVVRLWQWNGEGWAEQPISVPDPFGVISVAFSADGKILAMGCLNGLVRLWDVGARQGQPPFKAHAGPISSLALATDGKTLAVSSMDGSVRLWDPSGKELPTTFAKLPGGVTNLSFSPDGKQLAAAGKSGTVSVLDVTTGKVGQTLGGHSGVVSSVAFQPGGKYLASGGNDQTVRLWDLATGQTQVLKGHTGPVWSVAFSPDGKRLASGSADTTAKIWEVAPLTPPSLPQGERERVRGVAFPAKEPDTRKGHTATVTAVAFRPDGEALATASFDATVKIWDVSKGPERPPLTAQRFASVAFSTDGRTLATWGADNAVTLWDIPTGRQFAALKEHASTVRCAAFSADGKTLATGGEDKLGMLWEIGAQKVRKKLDGHQGPINSLAFSPDSQMLATAGADSNLVLWSAATGQNLGSWPVPLVAAVAFSPDGKSLALGTRQLKQGKVIGVVKVWEVATAAERAVFYGHTDQVTSVAFAPDGKALASGSLDKTIRLWNLKTGKETFALKHGSPVQAISFAPRGQVLASAGKDVRLWDVATGQERLTLQERGLTVWSIAFSPDGMVLASGCNDGKVKIWEAGKTAQPK